MNLHRKTYSSCFLYYLLIYITFGQVQQSSGFLSAVWVNSCRGEYQRKFSNIAAAPELACQDLDCKKREPQPAAVQRSHPEIPCSCTKFHRFTHSAWKSVKDKSGKKGCKCVKEWNKLVVECGEGKELRIKYIFVIPMFISHQESCHKSNNHLDKRVLS